MRTGACRPLPPASPEGGGRWRDPARSQGRPRSPCLIRCSGAHLARPLRPPGLCVLTAQRTGRGRQMAPPPPQPAARCGGQADMAMLTLLQLGMDLGVKARDLSSTYSACEVGLNSCTWSPRPGALVGGGTAGPREGPCHVPAAFPTVEAAVGPGGRGLGHDSLGLPHRCP